MTDARLRRLEEMLADEPNDAFLRYALAMEFRKLDRTDESLKVLDGLMSDSPPHIPSFLMAAQQLVEQGQIETARTALRTGIEEARKQDEAHAASEMAELLSSIGEL